VLTWSWANARLPAIASIVAGSLGLTILYHSEKLILDFGQYLSSIFTYIHSSWDTIVGLLFYLLILILFAEICFILISLFARRNLDGHRLTVSRQSIWSAARRGVLVGMSMSCIGVAFVILTSPMISGWYGDIRYDIYLVAIGCVSGLITGLIYGVSSGQLETHNSFKPNQGIWRSLYNGGRVLLVVGLIVWLVYDIAVILSYRRAVNRALPGEIINFPSDQFLNGVLVGISIGLFFGLLNGGIACIKHVLLRVFLWRAKAIPWNYVHFLDYAAERILLRKVGGGYIFVHRLLLEYFAALATPVPGEASAAAAIGGLAPAIASAPQIDTVQQEERASRSVPGRKIGFNKEKRIATLFAVVILLLALVCNASIFSVVLQLVQNANSAIATAQVKAEATTYVITATVQAERSAAAQAKVNTTAEAVANASPIAYPPQSTSPVLNDPLQDNSKGNNWQVDDPSKGKCKFINRAYDINTNQQEWCVAGTTDFTNFIYEVQMKVVKGDGGGIVFRSDPTNEFRSYYFAMNQNGSYSVHAYARDKGDAVLAQSSSPAIHRGLNQTNLVAAVVRGTIIELYVNYQRVAVVGASTYTHGRIGVIVTGDRNPTEVIFQNAQVWKL
jgi:hypothetical protein